MKNCSVNGVLGFCDWLCEIGGALAAEDDTTVYPRHVPFVVSAARQHDVVVAERESPEATERFVTAAQFAVMVDLARCVR